MTSQISATSRRRLGAQGPEVSAIGLGCMGMSEFYQGANFGKNLELVAKIRELAQRKGCTPGQLALAWVLAQGQDIVPIPGTKQPRYVDENLAALGVVLTPEDLRAIDAVLPAGSAAGDRYHAQAMAAVNR
jgi:aryl-alcohol dehydrogenase-like predicted oxidoreductase